MKDYYRPDLTNAATLVFSQQELAFLKDACDYYFKYRGPVPTGQATTPISPLERSAYRELTEALLGYISNATPPVDHRPTDEHGVNLSDPPPMLRKGILPQYPADYDVEALNRDLENNAIPNSRPRI